MTGDIHQILAIIYTIIVVLAVGSVIFVVPVVTVFSVIRAMERRRGREYERFLRKVCQLMGADYEKIDRRYLGHLVMLIELAVSMAGDPAQAASKNPIAQLIYSEFYDHREGERP